MGRPDKPGDDDKKYGITDPDRRPYRSVTSVRIRVQAGPSVVDHAGLIQLRIFQRRALNSCVGNVPAGTRSSSIRI